MTDWTTHNSFADIFYNNCFKNGMLPVRLEEEQVAAVMEHSKAGGTVTVDLEARAVTLDGGASFSFDVDEFRRHCLLNGLDDVALTLQKEDKIRAFEDKRARDMRWL